jgi:predicted porin
MNLLASPKRFAVVRKPTSSIATAIMVAAAACMSPNVMADQASDVYGIATNTFSPYTFGPALNRSMMLLYGTVDVAVNYTNFGGKPIVRVQSGNAWTTKFGIYGQEDLGQGWLAIFRLESGFNSNNGGLQDSTMLFNRAATIGLESAQYGKFSIGRGYGATGTSSLAVDPFYANAHEAVFAYMATASDLGYGANVNSINRINNVINYYTPRLGGVRAGFSYAFKGDATVGPRSSLRAMSLVYDHHGTSLALSYGQSWCDPAVSGNCNKDTKWQPSVRTDVFIASAQQDVGPVLVQGAFMQIVPRVAGEGIANVYTLGIQRFAQQTMYRAALVYRATTIARDYAYGMTLGADYYLSKRSALYARVGVVKNGPASNITYNYDSTAGGALTAYGHSVVSTSVGISHTF